MVGGPSEEVAGYSTGPIPLSSVVPSSLDDVEDVDEVLDFNLLHMFV